MSGAISFTKNPFVFHAYLQALCFRKQTSMRSSSLYIHYFTSFMTTWCRNVINFSELACLLTLRLMKRCILLEGLLKSHQNTTQVPILVAFFFSVTLVKPNQLPEIYNGMYLWKHFSCILTCFLDTKQAKSKTSIHVARLILFLHLMVISNRSRQA